MARKKIRQVDGSEASDSPEKVDSKGNCPHIHKGVDIGGLKRAWKRKDDISCHMCKKNQPSSCRGAGMDSNLCVCMHCGNVGCGSGRHDHAMEHFNTPRSDCHSVVALIDTWTLRCLHCKVDINLDANARASDAIAFLKKHLTGSTFREEVAEEASNATISKKNINNQSPMLDSKAKYRNLKEVKIYPVLGLQNLGNTCYLNAVLQCLAQTPRFVRCLDLCCRSKSTFRLSGGDNLIHENHGGYVPPLEGVLVEGGPLTKSLVKILQNIRCGEKLRKSGVMTENPGEIIRLVKKYSNTFYIGEQHDSHELLRILLEGLRTEDLKRYQRGILNAMNICPSTKEVLPKEHECLKAYKNEAIQKKLAVERLFGGTFVSVLKCLECDTVTTSFETFMDISLPVESEKVTNTEKQVPASEQRVSKYQLKKERKVARRSKKKGRGVRLPLEIQQAEPVIKESQSSDDSGADSEADIEDNLEAENVIVTGQDDDVKVLVPASLSNSVASNNCEDCEMGEDVSHCEDSSPGDGKLYPYSPMLFGSSTSRSCSPTIGPADVRNEPQVCHIQVRQDLMEVPSSIPESSPLIYQYDGEYLSARQELSPNEDLDSCEGGRGSSASSIDQADWDDGGEKKDLAQDALALADDVEGSLHVNQELPEIEPPEPFEYLSGESFKEGPCEMVSGSEDLFYDKLPDICSPMGRDNLSRDSFNISTNGGDDDEVCDKGLNTGVNHVSSVFDGDKTEVSGETLEQVDGGEGVWGTTLAPPSELETVVHSLEHCLRQFFHEEVLSGPNRIGCAHCTHGGKITSSDSNEKLLLKNALKQILFLKLPEVLTIHLKRFEVIGSRMSKISRKITFPIELDVSPYTSNKFEAKQPNTAPCYHLYGVIEHSGHMSSGHYVAYVKVLEEIPGCGESLETSAHGANLANDCQDVMGDLPKRETTQNNKMVDKWYYISDSYVKEVSEKDVLAAEAYILFYCQQI
ncbi:ubiquitin carboxyl-terminal hydrolase 16 isoform X2 [Ischnura elegans]|uniref:ubiquitin carboxyl-terminal hydrolase 16 isoform X2 n=1 Tax=Ischnura elegans TaxID=197161 RepID=UPI001ED8A2E0|nr:ubiquitin carboxyl-terminal hydrolase 16 isoform X2 [Ischnura elegans]